MDSRARRPALGWALALAAMVVLLAPAPAVAAPLDDGDPGDGVRWDAGKVLVRFKGGTDAAAGADAARDAGVKLSEQLPLIPQLFEADVPAGARVMDAVERLGNDPRVAYAQPDYVADDKPFTGPDDPAYWPNDPYFWSARFGNPNRCGGSQKRLGQWASWPLGQNLTRTDSAANAFNPLNDDARVLSAKGEAAYAQYSSINVLPVWALVRDAPPQPPRFGRTGRSRDDRTVWSLTDIRRSGIGVLDAGLSNHPDIEQQVAALFSAITVRSRKAPDNDPGTDFVRQVYRDDPDREDIKTINDGTAGETVVEDAARGRRLFSLDDWEASPFGDLAPPDGCEGHGTGVASTAAATRDNGRGTAGVAYDSPIVGVRPGMPWDVPGSPIARDDRLQDALSKYQRDWLGQARETNEAVVQQLAIMRALRVPILNVSSGEPLFVAGTDEQGRRVPVVSRPVVAEAYARLVSDGTLGVFAAGNDKQRYGSGRRAVGARLSPTIDGVPLPCGLELLADRPLYVEGGRRAQPWNPGIDFRELNLLCVGASTSIDSKLASFSGYGTAAVALAAPGLKMPLAATPRGRGGDGGVIRDVYYNTEGTSFSAPLVAGAAALLREAAPKAPMPEIAAALRKGARPTLGLQGKVRFGQLDVACALEWLAREALRRGADWNVVDTTAPDFMDATRNCGSRSARVVEGALDVDKSTLYSDARRHASFAALLESKALAPGDDSNSLAWQRFILTRADLDPDDPVRVAITIGSHRPVATRGGPAVYDAGSVRLRCDPGFRLAKLSVTYANRPRPLRGWFYPTDAFPPSREIEVGVVLTKPWYSGLMPATVKIDVRAVCQYFPEDD